MIGSEVLSGIAGGLISGFAVHKLALGREKRKERNAARMPIWRAFSEQHDSLSIYSNPLDTRIDALAHYKAVVSAREWRSYQRHAAEIARIRALEEWGEYDPKSGTSSIVRQLTDAEREKITHLAAQIARITRQR